MESSLLDHPDQVKKLLDQKGGKTHKP
jgi:hypothetical protein